MKKKFIALGLTSLFLLGACNSPSAPASNTNTGGNEGGNTPSGDTGGEGNEGQESTAIGKLRIVSNYQEGDSFLDGNTYLVFTSYEDVTLSVSNLYGAYSMSDAFKAEVKENLANLSWRTAQNQSEEERKDAADEDYLFSDEVTSYTVNKGEAITIGDYNMTGNVGYAMLEAILPGTLKIDETGLMYAICSLGASYALDQDIATEDLEAAFEPFLEANVDEDTALKIASIAVILSPLVEAYEEGTLTTTEIKAAIYEIATVYVGAIKALGVTAAVNQYIEGSMTAEALLNNLKTILDIGDNSSLSDEDKANNETLYAFLQSLVMVYEGYKSAALTNDLIATAIANFLVKVVPDVGNEKVNCFVRMATNLYELTKAEEITSTMVKEAILSAYELVYGEDSEMSEKAGDLLDAVEVLYLDESGEKTYDDETVQEKIRVIISIFLGEDNTLTIEQIRQDYLGGSLSDDNSGIVINQEMYVQKYKEDLFPNEVYEVEISSAQLKSLEAAMKEVNVYSSFIYNSATVASYLWNSAVGYDENNEKTALYISAQGEDVYAYFDLSGKVYSEILRLKDNEAAKEAGGKYLGNVELPMVFDGEYVLPDIA